MRCSILSHIRGCAWNWRTSGGHGGDFDEVAAVSRNVAPPTARLTRAGLPVMSNTTKHERMNGHVILRVGVNLFETLTLTGQGAARPRNKIQAKLTVLLIFHASGPVVTPATLQAR